ncbi:metal-dependent hydrolase [Halosimplex salinum]|uniref:metal-dependent hydrolase n=1 Tax=Halosimplex salinum TaxID=1710538 RepID=UPI000F4912E8|nr:metal-dependent hydrolase [Halosimplex salinum]
MLPWGHLAVGYLLYSGGTRLWHRRSPDDAPTLLALLGTQAPDLVDKPLNWWLAVFDGRGIGHSLLTTVPVCAMVYLFARRRGRGEWGAAFGFGVLTHLFADAFYPVLRGASSLDAPYLLWPLREAPTYPSENVMDHVLRVVVHFSALRHRAPVDILTDRFVIQVLLVPLVVGIWALDGFPGLPDRDPSPGGDSTNDWMEKW